MLKNRIEQITEKLNTVEDLIKALMNVPAKYELRADGQSTQICVDHDNERIRTGTLIEITDYVYDVEVNLTRTRQASKINIPDEKLKTFQPELYVVMGYTDTNENGNYEAQLQGVFSTKELAQECGDELIECGNIHHYEIESPRLDEFGWK